MTTTHNIPKVEYEIVGDKVIVTQDYHSQWISFGKGSVSDGYTIPKWLHWWHSPLEGELTPAILHDFMLKDGNPLAHEIFYQALLQFGFGRIKSWIMYSAVVAYQKVKYPDIFKRP